MSHSSALWIASRRPTLVGLAIVALFGIGFSGLSAASSASAATVSGTDGLEYVALGDSYAAGFGLTPLTGAPVPGCAQSSSDYPHQVAAKLGLDLTDVTCSGASIANLAASQVTSSGTADPQLDALSASTDIVTITIGGNDLGFSDIATDCAAAGASGPLFASPYPASCTAAGVPAVYQTKLTATVAPALIAAFQAVKAKAPGAKVFVVGYPSIAPATGGCYSAALNPNSFPFADADIPFLHGIQSDLDTAIKAASDAAGFTFVPVYADSVGHTICDGAASYVNGVTLVSTSPLTFAPGGLHPNAAGALYLTDQTSSLITLAFPDTTTPDPTSPTPAAPAGTLPYTGVSAGMLIGGGILAVLLIAMGSTMLLVSRRKHATRRQ